MARLEEIGFQRWAEAFDMKILELLKAFKEDYGQCNVPAKKSSNPLLGTWCTNIRCAKKKIQLGTKPAQPSPTTQDRQFNEIGFKWNLKKTEDPFVNWSARTSCPKLILDIINIQSFSRPFPFLLLGILYSRRSERGSVDPSASCSHGTHSWLKDNYFIILCFFSRFYE